MSGSLYACFRSRFPADRSRPFLETRVGPRLSYGDVESGSARLAHVLRCHGVAPGDRVAARCDKLPETLLLYLACLRAGALYLPLNPAYRAEEMGYFLADAEPRLLVCARRDQSWLSPLAQRQGTDLLTLDSPEPDRDGSCAAEGSLMAEAALQPDSFPDHPADLEDIAAICYTSGTTGRAKGAMLSHRALAANASVLVEAWGFESTDCLLHALPIFHVHGLFVALHCVLASGSRLLFLPRFETEEVLALLPRATVMMGVPTFYTRLLAHPEFDSASCRSIRLFISGSAPLQEETFQAFKERTGHTLLERYGMTEIGMHCANPLGGPRKPGCVGLPLPGCRIRLTDEAARPVPAGAIGQLEVAGPNLFSGYWRQPEKTAAEHRADGFFLTGDLARLDEDGYVCLVGRAKDLIISGGINVYPKEIEQVLDAQPGVEESAVFGVPHPDFGEAVVALVKPDSAAPRPPEAAALQAACRAVLAPYKCPKHILFASELPRNAMGKVQKSTLRTTHAGLFTEQRPSPGGSS